MELTGLLVAVSLFTLIMIILSYLIILISRKWNKRNNNRENYQSL
jgi:cbb3-type cytochrome oxidase subunit 3